MMIRGVLRHVAHELRHLNVVLKLALEGAVQHLALTRLEPVDHRGDRANDVCLGVEHQLLVDEVAVADLRHGVVHEGAVLIGVDPCLAVIRPLLVEGEVDGSVVLHAVVPVSHLVGVDGVEVLFRLLRRTCAQALVVLDVEALAVVSCLLPGLVLWHRVEAHYIPALARLHNGREELLEEAGQLCQRWPPRVDQVYQQALDVGAVVILIRHDHDGAVPEALQLLVVLAVQVEAHDLDDVLDLCVPHHLLQRRISDVEHLAAQREDAEFVPTDDAEARNGQRFGGVSLRQDQRALPRVLAARVVGVLQLRHAGESSDLAGVHLEALPEVNL
mmetsp:Transcript_2795/g.7232  ORF Transcript_2795/g.7232 Transcript_2795/m.7232 type:complete len:330 (-) Transcript_2795:1332-2321(-)